MFQSFEDPIGTLQPRVESVAPIYQHILSFAWFENVGSRPIREGICLTASKKRQFIVTVNYLHVIYFPLVFEATWCLHGVSIVEGMATIEIGKILSHGSSVNPLRVADWGPDNN